MAKRSASLKLYEVKEIFGASNFCGEDARLEVRVRGSTDMSIRLLGSKMQVPVVPVGESKVDQAQSNVPFINLHYEGVIALRDACNEWLKEERYSLDETRARMLQRIRELERRT